MATVTVKVAHTIERQRIEDLLVGAFEGGSNYWVRWAHPAQDGTPFYAAAFDQGVLVRPDGEPRARLLNMTAMKKGLKLMADRHARHMADLIAGNDDATTADVFLQLCLFGEVLYG